MSDLDPREVARQLAAAVAMTVNDDRGKAFERLASYMFESVGCVVRGNLTSALHSEQVDLAVAHMGELGPLPNFFLVECKYWEKPVSSAAVGYFIQICESRHIPLVVIVSRNGITGNKKDATRAHSLAYAASLRGTHVIVLTESDLQSATTNTGFIQMLVRAWLEAVATAGVGTP